MHKAKAGQVWQDKDTRGRKDEPATFEVTQTDGTPGGFAEGIRRPSGRKTRIRLDERGSVRGYRLVKEGTAEQTESASGIVRPSATTTLTAARIASALIRDMEDRSGLGDVWDEVHPSVRRELQASWVRIILQELERTPAESSSS